MEEEKGKIKILICLIVAMVVVIISTFFLNKRNDNIIMKKSLEEIGKRFYMEYLYETQKVSIDIAIKNNSNMSFNLNTLTMFISDDDVKKLNDSKLSKCNWGKTNIKFKPKSLNSKDDFDVEVKLVC